MAKPFSAATRICDAVADDPTLIRRLVAAYPALAEEAGAAVNGGWSLALDDAARIAGADVDAVLALANTETTPDAEGGRLWFEDGVPHLDVRGLEAPQPMVEVMRHLEGPETADRLIVHLDREPIHLFPILAEHGWSSEMLDRDADEVRLKIWRDVPMTLATGFLAGAKERVLPASIPYRYFGGAAVFHAAAWSALLIGAGEAVSFTGGTGFGLSALHLLTVGVLAMAAMGAALQLLPVATRQPMPSRWPARLGFWLLVPATLALGHGMATSTIPLLIAGGALAAAAFVVLGALIAVNLVRARGLPLVAAHGWVAIASLAALVALGLLIAFDLEIGFLDRHRDFARLHLVVAGYGFMGMLILGFSQILVPMFALTSAPDKRMGTAALWLSVLGLGLAVVGIVIADAWVVSAGIIAGLAASAAHLAAMARIMKARMVKRLGPSFVLVRAAWVLLPISLALALLDLHDFLDEAGGTMFGFMLFAGWLLTMLLAVLQRIMPFLATMHMTGARGRPPTISSLTAEGPLKVSTVCHLLAVAVAFAGIVAQQTIVMRVGAGIGLVGALAFLQFAGVILLRLMREGRREPAAAQTTP